MADTQYNCSPGKKAMFRTYPRGTGSHHTKSHLHNHQVGRHNCPRGTAESRTWIRRLCRVATLAHDLDQKTERQRLGLERPPAPDGGGTLAELFEWWLTTYSAGTPSHQRNAYSIHRHLTGSEMGGVRLVELTPGRLEAFLQQKSRSLAPQSVNHLRRFVLTALNCAKRAGRYHGPNPAAEVLVRKVPGGRRTS